MSRHRGYSYGGGGGRGNRNGVVWFGLGALFGFIGDFVYQTQGLYGAQQKAQGCEILSQGDIIQMAAITGLNALAIFTNSFTFSSLTSGMMAGNITPKLLALMHMPRYGIYDLGAGGVAKPTGGGARGIGQAVGNAAAGAGKALTS